MLFTTTLKGKEIIAVTDKFGLFNVLGTSSMFKCFKNFEEVKKKYKCFANISEFNLIDYDLPIEKFVDQFESAQKECDNILQELETWKRFQSKLKIIR